MLINQRIDANTQKLAGVHRDRYNTTRHDATRRDKRLGKQFCQLSVAPQFPWWDGAPGSHLGARVGNSRAHSYVMNSSNLEVGRRWCRHVDWWLSCNWQSKNATTVMASDTSLVWATVKVRTNSKRRATGADRQRVLEDESFGAAYLDLWLPTCWSHTSWLISKS